jgi:CRP/FNR family cyclic AMP-dependent transcriptional regulator
VVHIPAGWPPVNVAEPADQAYLVLEGRLCVVCGDTEVALLGPGSFARDLGFVDHRLRNARVVAVGPVRALTWSGSEFAQLREELPALERCCSR